MNKARKDIQVSTRVDGSTNELIDQLASLQGVSHAEIIRRAARLLASRCGIEQARAGDIHTGVWMVRR